MEDGHDEMRGNGQELSKTHTLTLRSFQLFREIWVETANSPHYFQINRMMYVLSSPEIKVPSQVTILVLGFLIITPSFFLLTGLHSR